MNNLPSCLEYLWHKLESKRLDSEFVPRCSPNDNHQEQKALLVVLNYLTKE